MDTSKMIKVSKQFLKESFERGLERKAWILYLDPWDATYSSGSTVNSAEEVDKYSLKGCQYWIELGAI